MKAIVSGGAGFIGSHLVDALIDRGDDVHIIDNLHSGRIENIHPCATLHVMDISNPEVKDMIVHIKPDVVFHLADQAEAAASVQTPNNDTELTIDGTINILDGCCLAQTKKFIFASSAAVYGENQKDLVSEKDPTAPISCYGLSKLTEESYIRLFSRIYQLPYTILRYANVFGPRKAAEEAGGVIAIFLNQLKKGEPLKIYGDGNQTRDFIYVKDIVKANLAAINHGDGEIIHASTAQTTSINQLINHLRNVYGSEPKTIYLDAKAADIRHSCLDNGKARKLLNFVPSYDIVDGLRETYEAEVLNKKRNRDKNCD
ncbi:NAD-dependent epimerase/dehydratase family protein [Sporolactobacillus sp. STCC-11]|uniref:NAD-dependent epimerase/dehydratase family protein n=1 Tax=Sporolactobacillus caesalpiniae TaxID=3230362 RepID=UPI003396CADA